MVTKEDVLVEVETNVPATGNTTYETRDDSIKVRFDNLCDCIAALTNRVEANESAIASLESAVATLETSVASLLTRVAALEKA